MDFAEPLLRVATQYLASRPGDQISEPLYWPHTTMSLISDGETIDANAIRVAMGRLQAVPFGEEPTVIQDLVAHGVTGVHCIMDQLQDRKTPLNTRNFAWILALSGSRIRLQKASVTNDAPCPR